MHISAVLLSLAVAAAMLASGVMKLVRAPRVVALMAAVHVTGAPLTVLGGLQVAATVGLVAGIWFPPLAVAAATGLVLYFAGAIVAHLRAGDRAMQGAGGFLGLAIATLVLLVLGS